MSSTLRRAVCAALVLVLLMASMFILVPANSQAASEPVFETGFDEASGWTSLAAVSGWHVNAGSTSGPYMLDSGILNAQLDGGGSCASHSLDLSGEYNVSFTLSIDGFFGSPAVAGAIGLYSGSANEHLYETTPDPASYRTARLYSDSVTNSFGFYSNQEGTITHAAPAWSMTTNQQYTMVLCRFHDGSGWHERNSVLNNQGTVVSYQERDLGTSDPVAITQFIICTDNDGISGTNYLMMMVDSLTVYDVAFPAGQTSVWVPSFTTTPPATGSVNGQYDYLPQLNETGTIELISGPGWASMDDGHVLGTPTEAGDYDFSLRGNSTAGTLSAWQNWTVTVQEAPALDASFSADPASGMVGLAMTFTPANRTYDAYSWDFGDEVSSTAIIPGHRYLASGTYNVTLTVTDAITSVSKTSQIVVSPLAWNETVTIKAVTTNLKVSVSYSLSDTSMAGAVGSVSWSFGDGSANQSGATAIHTYAKAGTFTVACTVTSVAGNTTVATQSVTVKVASSPTTVTDGGDGGSGSTSSEKDYSLILVGGLLVGGLGVVLALSGGKRRRRGRRRGW